MGVLLSIWAVFLGLSGFGGVAGADARDGVSITLREAASVSSIALPPIAGAASPDRPLVVVDPGHGGVDPGAVSPLGRRVEKDITLAVARAIRDRLASSGRVRVALTRDGDRHLSLSQRYSIARRLRADLFISVHADAAERAGASGATIYTLSEVASDREAVQLAARENGPGLEGAATLADEEGVNRILIDLAQREAMTRSVDFARLLHREGAPLIPFQPDYHRFASLIVLKAPDIPSILFETGYLTNEKDVAFISSPEGQRGIAEGVRKAVETHFARRALAVAPR